MNTRDRQTIVPPTLTITRLTEQLATVNKAIETIAERVNPSSPPNERETLIQEEMRLEAIKEAILLAIIQTPASNLTEAYVLATVAEHEVGVMSCFCLEDTEQTERWYRRVLAALAAPRREISRHAGVTIDSLGLAGMIPDQQREAA